MSQIARAHLLRWIVLFLGFFLLSYGSVMGIEAALGVAPWHVLHIGMTNHLPVTVGRASQYVGFLVLGIAVLLGVRPRLATWLNMLFIGMMMDFVIAHGMVPKTTFIPARLLYLVFGLLVMNLGVTLTICAGLGAGPRDSLMLGVTRKTGWRVGAIRSSLECGVVAIGFVLGGPVGIGTVVNAALSGPVVEQWMLLLDWLRARAPLLEAVITLPSVRIGALRRSEPDISASAPTPPAR